MKVVFVGGALDHINLPLCEAFYKATKEEFRFIATKEKSSSRTDLGYGSLNDIYTYVIKAYERENTALKFINEADAVIFGSAPESLVSKRMSDGKLTFRFTERLYKEPTNIHNFIHRFIGAVIHHGRYQNKQVYILAAGAYVANDFQKYRYYENRCFKWCYFTKLSEKSYETLKEVKSNNSCIELVWTARFVQVKHPELVIELAEYLKSCRDNFHITMVGGGELFENVKLSADSRELQDYITFTGALSPDQTREIMEKSHISLFTSDRGEGWGAVVNEAMGSACTVVASSAAGSPPFLIEHGVNGYLFNIEEPTMFFNLIHNILQDKNKITEIGEKAYKTVHTLWTPENAVSSFLRLSESIIEGNIIPAEFGPCSVASILRDGWFKGES